MRSSNLSRSPFKGAAPRRCLISGSLHNLKTLTAAGGTLSSPCRCCSIGIGRFTKCNVRTVVSRWRSSQRGKAPATHFIAMNFALSPKQQKPPKMELLCLLPRFFTTICIIRTNACNDCCHTCGATPDRRCRTPAARSRREWRARKILRENLAAGRLGCPAHQEPKITKNL